VKRRTSVARARAPPAIAIDTPRTIEPAAANEFLSPLDFSRPGKPTDNAFIESFNGKFRQECLNQHWFLSLEDTQDVIEAWSSSRVAVAAHNLGRILYKLFGIGKPKALQGEGGLAALVYLVILGCWSMLAARASPIISTTLCHASGRLTPPSAKTVTSTDCCPPTN
jgi:putative transposase